MLSDVIQSPSYVISQNGYHQKAEFVNRFELKSINNRTRIIEYIFGNPENLNRLCQLSDYFMIDGFTEFIFEQWCEYYADSSSYKPLEKECEKLVQCYKIVLKFQKRKKISKSTRQFGTNGPRGLGNNRQEEACRLTQLLRINGQSETRGGGFGGASRPSSAFRFPFGSGQIKRESTMKEIIEKWFLTRYDKITKTGKLKLLVATIYLL